MIIKLIDKVTTDNELFEICNTNDEELIELVQTDLLTFLSKLQNQSEIERWVYQAVYYWERFHTPERLEQQVIFSLKNWFLNMFYKSSMIEELEDVKKKLEDTNQSIDKILKIVKRDGVQKQ